MDDRAQPIAPLSTLAQQPRLQNSRICIVGREVLLYQFLIQLVTAGRFQSPSERHLSPIDVGVDHDRIYGPAQRPKLLTLMTGGTTHRASHICSAKAFSEALIARLPTC